MTAKFSVDPEIQSYLREQTPEEYATLTKLILAGEHVDALVVLHFDDISVLGDGHHRHRICEEHGIKFTTRTIKFANRNEAIEWVIENQLGRRNLTSEERAYFIGKQYIIKKRPHGNRENFPKGKNCPLGETLEINEKEAKNTAKTVAEENHVSERTVKGNAAFAEAVDNIAAEQGPEARKEILSGHTGQTKKEIIASAPVLCSRCQRNIRIGQDAVKNCDECKSLRKPAVTTRPVPEKKKRSAPSRNGQSISFDMREFDLHFGHVIRSLDQIGHEYDSKESKRRYAIQKQFEDARSDMQDWIESLKKEKA